MNDAAKARFEAEVAREVAVDVVDDMDRQMGSEDFAAMLEDKDTSVIGHRGLFIQAQRAGDPVAALFHARAAQEEAPRTGWAGDAVFQLETYEGDWDGALKTLDKMVSGGLVPRDKARRRRAVLLTAKAREIVAEAREDMSESGKARRTEALNTVSEAVEMEPAFTPAVTLAARLLGAEGKTRKATRLIERAWAFHPHPELLDTFLTVHRDESAFERHRHVQALAAQNPEHKESRIALAKGAIGSRDWEAARAALGHFLEGSAEGEPSVRICELMAEIEDGQFGNRGRAREWLSRALHAPRDEAWVSDGYVSQDWLPVCPRTGTFDAFEWKVPQSMIVPVASAPSAAAPLPAEREKTGREETGSEAETAPAEAVPRPEHSRRGHALARFVAPASPVGGARFGLHSPALLYRHPTPSHRPTLPGATGCCRRSLPGARHRGHPRLLQQVRQVRCRLRSASQPVPPEHRPWQL